MVTLKLYELYDQLDLYTDVANKLRRYGESEERLDGVLRKIQELTQQIQIHEGNIGRS